MFDLTCMRVMQLNVCCMTFFGPLYVDIIGDIQRFYKTFGPVMVDVVSSLCPDG